MCDGVTNGARNSHPFCPAKVSSCDPRNWENVGEVCGRIEEGIHLFLMVIWCGILFEKICCLSRCNNFIFSRSRN